MAVATKVIDVSAVLGVKVLCPDAPAENLLDRPFTAETHFCPGARSSQHMHPLQDERYDVVSGTLDLFVDDRWHHVGAGQSLSIAKGKVHAFRNATTQVATAINTHDPGLRFQEYVEVMERLIEEGKITSLRGLRNGVYLSLHSLEFSPDVALVQPPYWLRKLVAGLGHRLGYHL